MLHRTLFVNLIAQVNSLNQSNSGDDLKILVTLFASIASAILAIISIIVNLYNQNKLFIEGQNLKERDDIRYKLNNFFGSMIELRTESRKIYDVFALKEKREVVDVPDQKRKPYTTLQYLISGGKFEGADKALLDLIIELGEKQLTLIEKEGWAITNSQLTDLLGKLGAHIRVLILAKNGEIILKDDLSDIEQKEAINSLIFPVEIDGALDKEARILQDRYEELLGHTSSTLKKSNVLPFSNILGDHWWNIFYYETQSLQYKISTENIDLSPQYREFKKHIYRGDIILDAGCGIGRDTRYFVKNGYRVVAFDASHEMVKLCRRYPFAYCLHRTFDEIAFYEEFNAVWASASLVHLPKEKVKEALVKLSNSLAPKGIIFCSLKKGKEYQRKKDKKSGRIFYYYDEKTIDDIFKSLKLVKIKLDTDVPGNGCNWIECYYRKP